MANHVSNSFLSITDLGGRIGRIMWRNTQRRFPVFPYGYWGLFWWDTSWPAPEPVVSRLSRRTHETEGIQMQDLIVTGYRLWICKATETGWGPWCLVVSCHRDGTPRKNQVLSRSEAHSFARAKRKHWPDELIAVRPFWAGPPLPTAKRRPRR